MARPTVDKGFTGDGSVVSYFNGKETIMNAAASALAFALAISSTNAFAHTARGNSGVATNPMYRDAASPVDSQPKYRTQFRVFSGAKSADAWGHWGAYYGPMISAGGR